MPIDPPAAAVRRSFLPRVQYDVVIVGGGINGVGVARDCALRGLSTALFERHDLGFGASGNSTGFVHGGPRYLLTDPQVTREACVDSGVIQQIASHLVFRVPVVMPIERRQGLWSLTLHDAFFRAYDRFQPLKRGKPHRRLDATELAQLEPGLVGDFSGAVTFDEWGIDGGRLCVLNAVDAIESGAIVRNHCTVTEILRSGGEVRGVEVADTQSGERETVEARVVVNATGAWSPITAALGGVPPANVPVRPGKGIHVYLDRRLTNFAVVVQAIDGRSVFVFPWQNVTVVGTTDDDFYGDLDEVVAHSDEVRYLMQAAERVLPALREARVVGTWAGVRPTLFDWGLPEDRLSRDHRIVDHSGDGVAGLYSMIGGKLASYRWFAEQMTDVLARRLGVTKPCRTAREPLPGAGSAPDLSEVAMASGVDRGALERLVYRHGRRAADVLARVTRRSREGASICVCEPVTEAEIRFVVEHEQARTVGDVARRTRLGLGACGGMRCAARCGALVAQITELPPREGLAQAQQFLELSARRRLPALGPAQARQEVLLRSSWRAELGLGECVRPLSAAVADRSSTAVRDDTAGEGAHPSSELLSKLVLTVVGAGAAGTAAAWLAARAGAQVTLVGDRPGATELFSGALDLEEWEQAASWDLDPEVRAFAAALGNWRVDDEWHHVASASGVVRRARGIDASLLDLDAVAGGHLAVAHTDREDEDGQLLARALSTSPWAAATGTRVSAVRVPVLRGDEERHLPDHDFAQLHEDSARCVWLEHQLRAAAPSADGWLLGSWLGASRAVAPELQARLGRPVGETTSRPGGPAGARFAAGRDRLLAALGVRRIVARVRAVEPTDHGWVAELASGAHGVDTPFRVAADAVVLAPGGLVGGGIRMASPAELGGPGIRFALRAPVAMTLDGSRLASAGSLHGVELTRAGVGALERVGVAVVGARVVGATGLFAAGDCVAARPRTVLEAVRAGLTAARDALGRCAESRAPHS